MSRLIFEKTGNAVWISHLDLMRLFQRAFKRAGLPLKHTQGFNPRPSVSIGLPLSVGVESKCELLDFELDNCHASCEELCTKLNNSLVPGVRVLKVYENGNKIRNLSLLDCNIYLEYDDGVPTGCVEALRQLYARQTLIVPKKSKNGIQEHDIVPMIRSVQVEGAGENTVLIRTRICCQNPTLNPVQLTKAIEIYLPEFLPNFSKCQRIEIYDAAQDVFR